MKLIWGILITISISLSTAWSQENWELTNDQLDSMIHQAEIIFEGKLKRKKSTKALYLKVSQMIQGPQKLSKVPITSDMSSHIERKRSYIFFMKKQQKGYVFLNDHNGSINNHALIKTRVRREVMKRRTSRADFVVLAQVKQVAEFPQQNNKVLVQALCEMNRAYKEKTAKDFQLIYTYDSKANPRQLFLFSNFSHVFFLNKPQQPPAIVPLFRSWDLLDFDALTLSLYNAKDPFTTYIKKSLGKNTREMLDVYILTLKDDIKNSTRPRLEERILKKFNKLLKTTIGEPVTKQIKLTNEIKTLMAEQNKKEYDKIFLNRLLFEAAYPKAIARHIRDSYDLADLYEGALPDRHYIMKEVSDVTRVNSQLEEAGGHINKGLRAVAHVTKNSFTGNEPIMVNFLVQNMSKDSVKIYHNHILYFVKIHIVDVKNNKFVPVKYPKKTEPLSEKRHFLNLPPQQYFFFPIDVGNFCRLTVGKYQVYIELDIPEKYSGEKWDQNAWFGKVISRQLEIEVK